MLIILSLLKCSPASINCETVSLFDIWGSQGDDCLDILKTDAYMNDLWSSS
jgi:hypothetical protein